VTHPDKSKTSANATTELPEPASRPLRKQYARPVLVEYGPIGKLTRSGSATIGDSNAMKMSCL
jgi:hypothetical protein